MADTNEALQVKKRRQANEELLQAVNYGLEESIQHAGGVVSGLSVKFGETDYLMTIRAQIGSKRVVAFVGAPTLRDCFRKATQQAWSDGLKWKTDRFGNGSG